MFLKKSCVIWFIKLYFAISPWRFYDKSGQTDVEKQILLVNSIFNQMFKLWFMQKQQKYIQAVSSKCVLFRHVSWCHLPARLDMAVLLSGLLIGWVLHRWFVDMWWEVLLWYLITKSSTNLIIKGNGNNRDIWLWLVPACKQSAVSQSDWVNKLIN